MVIRNSAKNLTLFKNRSTRSMTFFSRPVIRRNGWKSIFKRLWGDRFWPGWRRSDGEHPAGSPYEAESFLLICPMKAKHLVRLNIWSCRRGVGSLTGRTNKDNWPSLVLKAVVAISRASQMGEPLTNRARKRRVEKELVTAYNQDKTIHINRLRDLGK